jgi:NAD(P)-dependent dehydrogenase (short-subunit alcohol dehydrogenase family)
MKIGLLVKTANDRATSSTRPYQRSARSRRRRKRAGRCPGGPADHIGGVLRPTLPAVTARGGDAIINVASTVSFQPVPHMAVYGATKAFVLSLTEALRAKTRSSGARITIDGNSGVLKIHG